MANTIKVMVFPLGGSLSAWLEEQCAQSEWVQVVMPAVPSEHRHVDGADHYIGLDQFCRQCLASEHTPLPATELDVQMAIWSSISILPEDGFLRPACQYPGNISSLSHTMNELARHQMTGTALLALAEAYPLASAKLNELARLAEELRRRLRSIGRVLQGDLWHMASDALENHPGNRSHNFYFLGFDRAPQAFRDLLEICAGSGDVRLLVEGDLDRPQLFGSLHSLLADLEGLPSVEVVPQPATLAQNAVQWLVQNLGVSHPELSCIPTAGQIIVVDAPSPLVEADMLARELLRRHRDGIDWSDMCVVLPNMQEALPGYELVLTRLGVPFQTHGGSLLDHPQVMLLMRLIASISTFNREDALQLLRMGVMQIDIYELERLRRASRESGVKSGLMLLQLPSDNDAPRWSDGLLLACQRLSSIVMQLQVITEPADLVDLLNHVAVELGFSEPEADEQTPVDRFVELASSFILSSGIEISELSQPLKQIIAFVSIPATPASNAVRIVSHLPVVSPEFSFLAMPSLLEGVMPGSSREDPLIGDDLRTAMAQLIHRRLPLSHESSDLDRLQFLRAIAHAPNAVWMSCPRMNGDREALPSYLLSAVLQMLPKGRYELHERRLHEASYPVTEMVAEADWHARLAERLYARDKEIRTELVTDELPLLTTLAKRAVNSCQDETKLWTEWSEWPQLPKLIPQASRPVRREFGVTELQQMMQCRYRHFARWQLGLRSSQVSAMSIQGRWVHEVLRTALQQHQNDVETLLKEVAEQLPADLHHGEQALLYEDTGAMCTQILDREQRVYAQFGLTPTLFEAAFGRGDDPEEPGVASMESMIKPLSLPLDEGHMRIAGRLDRVDVCPRTGLAVLIDYKRSVPRDWFDRIAQGEDIQMPIYISALQNLFSLKVGAVAIDSGKAEVRYRVLLQMNIDQEFQQRLWQRPEEGAASRVGNEMWWRLMYQNVASKLKQSASLLASGDILPVPGDWCAGCHYQHLCRTQQGANGPIHDGQRYPSFG